MRFYINFITMLKPGSVQSVSYTNKQIKKDWV